MTITPTYTKYLYNVKITTANGQTRYVPEYGQNKKEAMRNALYKADDWRDITALNAYPQHITVLV